MSDQRISRDPLPVPVAQPAAPSIHRPPKKHWSGYQIALLVIMICGIVLCLSVLSFFCVCVGPALAFDFIEHVMLRNFAGPPPVGPPRRWGI